MIAGVAAGAAATQQGRDYYASTSDNNSNLNPYYTTGSTESAYPPDPAHLVQHSETYQPYDHDDGLGAIGRAATSPTEAQYPIDPATAAAAAGFNGTYSVVSGISSGSSYSTPASARQSIQTVTSPLPIAPLQPRPQHLANVHRSELLRTPPPNEADEDALSHAPAPPSYGLAVSEGAREYRPIEKSGKI